MGDGRKKPADLQEDDMDIFSGALAGQLAARRHRDDGTPRVAGRRGRRMVYRVVARLALLTSAIQVSAAKGQKAS